MSIEDQPTIASSKAEENEQDKTETHFPPELMEKIMEKVSDINMKGNAISALLRIDPQILSSVFKRGLLGGIYPIGKTDGEIKAGWKESAKKSNSIVFANIIGRDIDSVSGAYYQSGIYVVFHLNNFKERLPKTRFSSPGSSRSFRIDKTGLNNYDPEIIRRAKELGINENATLEELKSFVRDNRDKFSYSDEELLYYLTDARQVYEPEYGFLISHRVPPRNFRGIVVRGDITHKIEEILACYKIEYKEKSNLIVPIYDIDGNLLWPKQISYEEVKRFVSDREAKGDEAKQKEE